MKLKNIAQIAVLMLFANSAQSWELQTHTDPITDHVVIIAATGVVGVDGKFVGVACGDSENLLLSVGFGRHERGGLPLLKEGKSVRILHRFDKSEPQEYVWEATESDQLILIMRTEVISFAKNVMKHSQLAMRHHEGAGGTVIFDLSGSVVPVGKVLRACGQ